MMALKRRQYAALTAAAVRAPYLETVVEAVTLIVAVTLAVAEADDVVEAEMLVEAVTLALTVAEPVTLALTLGEMLAEMETEAEGLDEATMTERMRWFCVSLTKIEPAESTAMPVGLLKVAALPTPSATPGLRKPAPASVVTAPPPTMPRVTVRTALLNVSATKRFVPAIAIPVGLKNTAFVPLPSAMPRAPLPASVDTWYDGNSTTRI